MQGGDDQDSPQTGRRGLPGTPRLPSSGPGRNPAPGDPGNEVRPSAPGRTFRSATPAGEFARAPNTPPRLRPAPLDVAAYLRVLLGAPLGLSARFIVIEHDRQVRHRSPMNRQRRRILDPRELPPPRRARVPTPRTCTVTARPKPGAAVLGPPGTCPRPLIAARLEPVILDAGKGGLLAARKNQTAAPRMRVSEGSRLGRSLPAEATTRGRAIQAGQLVSLSLRPSEALKLPQQQHDFSPKSYARSDT